jgi:hypothetical protein
VKQCRPEGMSRRSWFAEVSRRIVGRRREAWAGRVLRTHRGLFGDTWTEISVKGDDLKPGTFVEVRRARGD